MLTSYLLERRIVDIMKTLKVVQPERKHQYVLLRISLIFIRYKWFNQEIKKLITSVTCSSYTGCQTIIRRTSLLDYVIFYRKGGCKMKHKNVVIGENTGQKRLFVILQDLQRKS